MGLGAIAERRRIAAPGSGPRIENKGLGLLESLEEPVMDFGLADQPPDDLRFRDVEGLVAIRPVAFAPWMRHAVRKSLVSVNASEGRRLRFFGVVIIKVHGLDRPRALWRKLVAKKRPAESVPARKRWRAALCRGAPQPKRRVFEREFYRHNDLWLSLKAVGSALRSIHPTIIYPVGYYGGGGGKRSQQPRQNSLWHYFGILWQQAPAEGFR